jgi:hypothetical protein
MKMRWWWLLLAMGGCAAQSSPLGVCPALVPYTEAEQQTAADELEAPPDKPMLERMMADYGDTRAKLRKCQ